MTERVKECIFKVSWDVVEDSKVTGFPSKRQITAGTMVAIDWQTRRLRARLISDAARENTDAAAVRRLDRDRFLQRLADEGVLRLEREAIGPHGRHLRSVIRAETSDGLMRVRDTARMLHIVRG